ncbi:hypothetical protein [Ottowia testudinis]|uniref:Uncharacterized protein n=1 Tax=Ottowia testudinis TaxID=2816950 RepID=A0A975CEK2_9BURK|nr:hypothetical protein [Ottowia testudinis]QTD44397.1 hypothetical protein J1M35_15000 [Ottowia testudinis]
MAFIAWALQTSSHDFDEELHPMKHLQLLDPVCMTGEARVAEIASLLAQALLRMRIPATHSQLPAKEPQNSLGLCPPKSVHSKPASRVRNAVRQALLAKTQGV